MAKPTFDSGGAFTGVTTASTSVAGPSVTSVSGGFPLVAVHVKHGTRTCDAVSITDGGSYTQALTELFEVTAGGVHKFHIYGLPDGGTVVPASASITSTLTMSTSSGTWVVSGMIVVNGVSDTAANIIASIVSEADKSVDQASVSSNELVVGFAVIGDETSNADDDKITATGTSQTERTTEWSGGEYSLSQAIFTQTAEGAVTTSWTFQFTEDYAHTVSLKLSGASSSGAFGGLAGKGFLAGRGGLAGIGGGLAGFVKIGNIYRPKRWLWAPRRLAPQGA